MSEIKTVVLYSQDFEHKPATGVYCGPTGPDTLFLEFFLERQRQSGTEIRQLVPSVPDGIVKKPFEVINERIVVGGFSMSVTTARMLRGLLDKQIAQVEAFGKQNAQQMEFEKPKTDTDEIKTGSQETHGGYL